MNLANENYVGIKNTILKIKDKNERDVKIARWAISFLPEYHCKDLPPRPAIIEDYYKQPDEERRKMNQYPYEYPKFWHNPEVKEYFDAAEKVKNTNKRNHSHLLWMQEVLKGEIEEIDIDQALSTHEGIKQPQWSS
jgi:hypothetical protein